MSPRSKFDPSFEQLPETLPIFPLSGVLLLPGGKLPLNIFEPRYLDLIKRCQREQAPKVLTVNCLTCGQPFERRTDADL